MKRERATTFMLAFEKTLQYPPQKADDL